VVNLSPCPWRQSRGIRCAFSVLSVLSVLSLTACSSSAQTTRVILPPGATFAAVTDSLKAHGVVANPQWFKLMARLRGVDRSVHAGVYEFPAGTSPWAVLTMLARGKKAALRFTVPEGLTILDVAELAATRLGIPEDSFVAAARNGKAATALLGFPVPSFEGFLRPETYILPADINAHELIRLMAEGFNSDWKPEWDTRLDSLKMSRLALVTLASIVEGEAKADEERETIAGVYRNRLRIGMALQADPTVQYAISLKRGTRKPRLFQKDYQIQSPYNTYLQPGLPPGPVNSPGRRSLEAALYPADVRYLYFVAGPDGRHVFSRTYGEHLKAIRKVRRSG
jgi:UPF0755 protein